MKEIKLKDYQEKILNDLKYLSSVGILTKTGSGKTIMALSKALSFNKDKLLVLSPAKAIEQWESAIKEYTEYTVITFKKAVPSNVRNAYLKSNYLTFDKVAVVISLESVARFDDIQEIVNENWTIILDESHKIKEIGSKRKPIKVVEKCLALGKKTDYKIILSATPTQKKNGGWVDYLNQLKFLGYMDMTYAVFKDRYCNVKKIQPIGRPYPIEVIDSYRNTHEIEKLLELTCRSYNPKYGDYEPEHIVEYVKRATTYAKTTREKFYKDLDLTNLSRRRLCYKTLVTGTIIGENVDGESCKYDDNTIKLDWLRNFINGTPDERILVFYNYNVERDNIVKMCSLLKIPYIVIDGKNKNKYEDITTKDYQVIIGQYKACGESIDGIQHKCHVTVYFSLPESSIDYRQSLGRTDRVGQVEVPRYYFLVMEKTIDEVIFEMMQNKVQYSEETLEKLLINF